MDSSSSTERNCSYWSGCPPSVRSPFTIMASMSDSNEYRLLSTLVTRLTASPEPKCVSLMTKNLGKPSNVCVTLTFAV